MSDEPRHNIDDIDDIELLRTYLRDTTQQLQTAAQMGLGLAQQNQTLRERLDAVAQEQEDLHQRLSLMERDRRWMQDQSLRVDQVRESLNELALRVDGGRSRRLSVDQQMDALHAMVEKMREDVDAVVVALEESRMRKWAGEVSALQRALAEVKDNIAALGSRNIELSDKADSAEMRHRAQHAEISRALSDLSARMDVSVNEQNETRAQIDWAAARQGDMEQSLKSVISEYNAMLNEHEQTIRILGESQAVLESQAAIRDRRTSDLFHPAALFTPSPQPMAALNAPASAGPRGRRSKVPGHTEEEEEDDDEVLFVGQQKPKKDSGVGESLGDIFANDASPFYEPYQPTASAAAASGALRITAPSTAMAKAQQQQKAEDEHDAAFPSPPLSLSQELDPSPISEHLLRVSSTLPSRKAASVIGAPNKPKTRSRPRNSSFSKAVQSTGGAGSVLLHDGYERQAVSPSKAASGFGGIISSSAHVGLGWGNYWEARRHRLRFDIQQRLGLPAVPAPSSSADAVSDKMRNVDGSKQAAETAAETAAGSEELGIED
ncbi:hypothetical protein GQ54DRAFT_329531 [Martensiomyces pterosporus]|nr:hypothetical protein GQ54DRAFT_329531 [Martensiomyces pterosporus]